VIGEILWDVKKNKLAHGQFEPWIRNELKITPQHARKYMRVFDVFGRTDKEIEHYLPFGPTFLFKLSALPEKYIEEIKQKATSDGLSAEYLQSLLDVEENARTVKVKVEGQDKSKQIKKSNEKSAQDYSVTLEMLASEAQRLKKIAEDMFSNAKITADKTIDEGNYTLYKQACGDLFTELNRIAEIIEGKINEGNKAA
jgi:hypothetical protein